MSGQATNHYTSDLKPHELYDEFSNRLNWVRSMSMMLMEEEFLNWSEDIRHNYLRAMTHFLEESTDIASILWDKLGDKEVKS